MQIDPSRLNWLTAVDAARAIRDGAITSVELVEACLERVREVDDQVQAWAFLDPDAARAQARAADAWRQEGNPTGALHGVPVGLKDIIDTGDQPTEDGSVLHAGRTPDEDASVVTLLRTAGAVIMGKTVTTEFANRAPGKTRNPHHPGHTPGGSSSGSAAAVAAGMVPLAVGTQTGGSVIRPASFCGVYGFKPSHGMISRHGILKLSRTLDHVGVFARSIEDLALLSEQVVAYDVEDPDTRPRARIPFGSIAAQEPPLRPMLAFARTAMWDLVEPDAKEAYAELVAALGDCVVELDLPESTAQVIDWHRTIMQAEMAANLDREWDLGRDRLSDSLRELLASGREVSALDYQRALARIPLVRSGFAEIFERCDAIITPATRGTAPEGLESTGDPVFCSMWTYCGMPALNLPLMQGANGLPLGVQLVGRRGDDARLLRTARWLTTRLSAGD